MRLAAGLGRESCGRLPAGQCLGELRQAAARIGHQRQAAPFAGVEGLHIQADDAGASEQTVRTGGEVLQAAADGQHHVGLCGQGIGCWRARHADSAHVQRMVPGQAALAGLGFRYRNAMHFGEGPQGVPGLAVQNAATCNDDRALRAAQQGSGLGQLVGISGRPAKAD